MELTVNGAVRPLPLDARVSLLDYLRDHLHLTGAKKGCDQGGCGACTVLLDGRRVLACLTLAVQCEGRVVRTIEDLAPADGLHPLQQAFIDHDGFQCGYCTPGQVCSALAMLDEFAAGEASRLDAPSGPAGALDADGIRERMSGNLCRCAAYNGIVDAIADHHRGASA